MWPAPISPASILIVVEVLALEHAVLVADQSVLRDHRRVELDLDLHVPGDGPQRSLTLRHEHTLGLRQGIDVRMIAVAGIGQLLHQVIVVVAGAEAERRKRDAALALFLDQVHQGFKADRADVEIAIRRQQDAVVAVLHERFLGHRIRKRDAGAAIGRAAGLEPIKRGLNGPGFVTRSRFQHHARIARVNHEADAVRCGQLPGQEFQRGLHQRELVGVLHRAGYVHQEHEVRCRSRALRLPALNPDMQQAGLRIPRGRRHFRNDSEGRRRIPRSRIGVVEIVDELFHAYRVLRRQAALVQHPPYVAVGTRIHVDAERRHRILGNAMHRVRVDLAVVLAIHGRRFERDHRRLGQHVAFRDDPLCGQVHSRRVPRTCDGNLLKLAVVRHRR